MKDCINIGRAHKVVFADKTMTIPQEGFLWELFDRKTGILQGRHGQTELTISLDRKGRLNPQASVAMTPVSGGRLWQHILSIEPLHTT